MCLEIFLEIYFSKIAVIGQISIAKDIIKTNIFRNLKKKLRRIMFLFYSAL